MLQLNTIREEKDRVLSGLKKRNFKELTLIDDKNAVAPSYL